MVIIRLSKIKILKDLIAIFNRRHIRNFQHGFSISLNIISEILKRLVIVHQHFIFNETFHSIRSFFFILSFLLFHQLLRILLYIVLFIRSTGCITAIKACSFYLFFVFGILTTIRMQPQSFQGVFELFPAEFIYLLDEDSKITKIICE